MGQLVRRPCRRQPCCRVPPPRTSWARAVRMAIPMAARARASGTRTAGSACAVSLSARGSGARGSVRHLVASGCTLLKVCPLLTQGRRRRREAPRQHHAVCSLPWACRNIISPACHHALPWAATARGGRGMTHQSTGQTPQLSARVHPDDRGRIEGLNALATLIQGAPQPRMPLRYYTPILIQCTLPHSDPKTPSYAKTNGDFSLIVSSGFDRDGKPYGIPYGSLPRLVLAYIITRVIETGERRTDLSSHFSGFMREIGYTGNHKGTGVKGRRVRGQLVRLLRASITFEGNRDGHLAVQDVKVAPKFELWWDYKNPEQDSLFGSYIDISEDFRQAILRAPVPLRTDILKALRKSPLALDVYMWTSYRLFVMQSTGQEALSLGYGRLQKQFGTGIAEENYRLFRSRLKQAFADVDKHWRAADGENQALNYEFEPTKLLLYRSPLLVNAKPTRAQEAARRILESRSFDEVMRRKARQLAGKWDVPFLTRQYFDWIEREGIAPKDPCSHFLDFIKTHRQRHGETV